MEFGINLECGVFWKKTSVDKCNTRSGGWINSNKSISEEGDFTFIREMRVVPFKDFPEFEIRKNLNIRKILVTPKIFLKLRFICSKLLVLPETPNPYAEYVVINLLEKLKSF